MRRLVPSVLILLFPSTVLAQHVCRNAEIQIRAGVRLPYPDGATGDARTLGSPSLVRIVGDDVRDLNIAFVPTEQAAGWIVAQSSLEEIRPLSEGEGRLGLLWSGLTEDQPGCIQRITDLVDAPTGETADEPAEAPTDAGPEGGDEEAPEPPVDEVEDQERRGEDRDPLYEAGECRKAGSDWLREISDDAAYRGRDVTVIVFLEDNAVCYFNRERASVGDPIFVGVFTPRAELWDRVQVQFEPCAVEPEAPRVYISGKLTGLFVSPQAGEWSLREFLPRTCFNKTVNISLTGRLVPPPNEPDPSLSREVSARYTLQQYSRYRATVQLGVLFTDLQDQEFGLRPDDEGNDRIFNKGPVGTGPRYFASLVVYGVLRYLPSLFGDPRYLGRDIINDNNVLDRIGAVIGVGLNDPGAGFVGGFSFEVIAGINGVAAWEFARIKNLEGEGVAVDAIFEGGEEEIPTKKVWETDFTFGLSIDLVYIANLLQN